MLDDTTVTGSRGCSGWRSRALGEPLNTGPLELPESVWSRILVMLWTNYTVPHSRLVCRAWARYGERFALRVTPSTAPGAQACCWTSRWTGCQAVSFERIGSLVQDRHIEALANLPYLNSLTLRRPVRIVSTSMVPLQNKLEILHVNMLFGAYPRGGPDVFFQSISSLTRLTTLRLQLLDHPRFASAQVLPHLKHLDITGSKPVRKVDVVWMSTLPRLQSIDLTKCGDIGHISVLRVLTDLRALDLRDCGFDVADLAHLTSLRVLSLRRCKWRVDGGQAEHDLRVVAALRQLQSLDIASCSITDPELDTIRTLSTIRRLGLAGCADLSDEAIRTLVEHLSQLRYIDLSWNFQLSRAAAETIRADVYVQADGCAWGAERQQEQPPDMSEGLSTLSI